MKYDLKSMTRKELEKLSNSIDKALTQIVAKEKKAALAAAEKAVKAHGFMLADITAPDTISTKGKRKTTRKAKAPSKPKFANPSDATQTWTGKGRRPDWFVAAIEAGKTPDDLVI
ncbi:H-NS family nucleoid-associated regulatory protein [Yoonia sp. R2-816]|uniref:H-NS histone family protein n=1 Tax=Yoonia sp. R2-816 TaxID=3342638 RepID=UPI00372A7D32